MFIEQANQILEEEDRDDDEMGPEESLAKIHRAVSDTYIYGFHHRHPEIKSTTSEKMEIERMRNATPTKINDFFDHLEVLFAKNHYEPSVVGNFDEFSLSEGKRRWSVWVPSECKRAVVPILPDMPHLTGGLLTFGDGTFAEPLIVYPNTTVPSEITLGTLRMELKYSVAGQARGWMTASLFEQYCEKILIPEYQRRLARLPPGSRGILLLDGHSSRTNGSLMEKLDKVGIDVYTFIAHTSHVGQPNDIVVFGVLKSNLKNIGRALANKNLPTKRAILTSRVLKALWSSCYPGNIMEAFKRAGIVPLDRNQVLVNPRVVHEPLELVYPEIANKERRSLDINNKLLTSDEMISKLKEANETSQAKKRPASSLPKSLPTAKKPKINAAVAYSPALVVPLAPSMITGATPTASILKRAPLTSVTPTTSNVQTDSQC